MAKPKGFKNYGTALGDQAQRDEKQRRQAENRLYAGGAEGSWEGGGVDVLRNERARMKTLYGEGIEEADLYTDYQPEKTARATKWIARLMPWVFWLSAVGLLVWFLSTQPSRL